MTKRCSWAEASVIEKDYHDNEWGIPCFDDYKLFEQLCLEGQQSGLSWRTVLLKREAYRRAFFNFQPEKIVGLTPENLDDLSQDASLIRYRLKLESIVKNSHAYLELRKTQTLSEFLWKFVDNTPMNLPGEKGQIIAKEISKALKKQGFAFVGPTTVYAFMQAVGMVNDHEIDCFRKEAI